MIVAKTGFPELRGYVPEVVFFIAYAEQFMETKLLRNFVMFGALLVYWLPAVTLSQSCNGPVSYPPTQQLPGLFQAGNLTILG